MKKNDDRFITAIFCDDIRQEIGNKFSYMGCYTGEIVVKTVPAVLPKLCVSASISTPQDRPFKSLILRVVQDNEVEFARVEIPEQGLAESSQMVDGTATRASVNTAIVLSPFVIEKPTMLRLMAMTEEGEITGPRVLIKVAATQETAAQPAKNSKTKKPRTIK